MFELFFLLIYDIVYIIWFFIFFILFLKLLFYDGKASEGFNSFQFFNYKIYFMLLILGLFYCYLFKPVSLWMGFDYLLFNDYFSDFFLLFFYFIFFLFLLLFVNLNEDYFYYYEYLFILMLVILFVGFLFKVFDLMFLFILVEGLSLCLYILVSSNYSSITIGEASIKYFILAVLSSLFFLLAICIIYFQYGTFNLMKLKFFFLTSDNQISLSFFFACLLLIGSFFFKLGIVPFQLWVVEVYYGVSLSTFFFLSVYSKYIFFVVFFKLFLNFLFFFNNYFFWIFLISGFLSIFFGIMGSLVTVDIKKIMAYGSIVHSGFIILCFLNFSYYSIYAFIFYLFSYIFLMINFFIIFLLFKMFDFNLNTIFDLVYIKQSSVFLSFVLFFIFLSMAGIPPFIGFFSKYFVLYNLYILNYNYIYVILLILLLNIIGVFVYLRFGIFLFFAEVKYKIFYIKKFKILNFLIVLFFFINFFGFIFCFILYKYCYILIFYNFICFI